MNKEENVYEETTKAENVAEAKAGVGERREGQGSAVLGKFKDVDALANAYSSLQAEFTRRSQRLRELERAAENFSFAAGAEGTGAEKLRKNASARRSENKRFDEFLDELNGGQEKRGVDEAEKKTSWEAENTVLESPKEKPAEEKVDAKDTAQEIAGAVERVRLTETEEPLQEKGTETEQKREQAFSSVAGGDATLSSEELYERANRDEKIRLRIIGEYLASIGRSGAPLTSSGAGAFVTPPLKAKSIDDAGDMALRYFKSGGEA